jgi:hypothetical protein
MKVITYPYSFPDKLVMILVSVIDPQLTTSNFQGEELAILP